MNPAEGLTLGSRYTLTDRIAVGGMGEVWKARDARLGREVAVKVMRPSAADEQEFVDRFRDEARHTASLQHPNIATVFDYGEDDGAAYLVMELVDGLPLSQLIARGPFAPERVRSIMGQAALALAAAHAQGVVHRDVKPANILITSEGRVKLTDFGIASAGDGSSHTRTGEVLGTPHYLSPEQAVGKAATGASDIYALGIVAQEMLTGVKPFDAGSAVATALQQVNDPPPPMPPGVPPDLRRIVESCLSKDPAVRPSSAAALAASLGIPVTGLAEVDPAVSVVHTGYTDPSATAVVPPAQPTGTAVLPAPVPVAPVSEVGPPPQEEASYTTQVSRRERREELDDRDEKRSSPWIWIVPIVATIAAIAFLVYEFNHTGSTPLPAQTQTVTAPAVTSTATSATTTTDTSSSTTTDTSSSTTTAASPTAGTISKDSYVGTQVDDAIARLNRGGWQVQRNEVPDEAAPAGTVIDVNPSGTVPFSQTVTLTVSSGPTKTSSTTTKAPPTTPGGGPSKSP